MNQLDKDIYELKEERKVLLSLERLLLNQDFKKVILEDFLTKHPLILIQGKGKLNLDPQQDQDINRQLDCVALFKMYLDSKISEIADIDIKISNAETLRDQQTSGNTNDY